MKAPLCTVLFLSAYFCVGISVIKLTVNNKIVYDCKNKTTCDVHGKYGSYYTGLWGHYYEVGYCDCNPGYWNICCTQEANACTSFPCMHGGTCMPNQQGYACTCTSKSTGIKCEKLINPCDSYPCHRALCTPLQNDYMCKCLPGTSGKNCENGYYTIG